MTKEKIESVCKALGAVNRAIVKSSWYLPRMNDDIRVPPNKADQWLLIGEITEALREKGCWKFANDFGDAGKFYLGLFTKISEYGPGREYESKESLFDCYLQAATELLGEEVI